MKEPHSQSSATYVIRAQKAALQYGSHGLAAPSSGGLERPCPSVLLQNTDMEDKPRQHQAPWALTRGEKTTRGSCPCAKAITWRGRNIPLPGRQRARGLALARIAHCASSG